jgi:hypothetical protein
LCLDTEAVAPLPDGNYGFEIYKVKELAGKGGSIEKAETRIRSVELSGDDGVVLTLSRRPVHGERLTYGINGDYWQNIAGEVTVAAGGEGEDKITKAGRIYGSRGNLRDSQGCKNNRDGAKYRDMYNWCAIFEINF